MEDVNAAALVEELARLDVMEQEYMAAWERSKMQSQRTITRRVQVGDGGRTEAQVIKEDQHGDPRYLQGAERCIRRRCELLGLEGGSVDRRTKQLPAPSQPSWLEVYETKMLGEP